jgi:hypothetical protein
VTVLDLVKSSLRLIGQLGPGRGAGASELADALLVLNSMIEAWNTERLNVFTIARDVYTVTAGRQVNTIGVGGNFNAPRPTRIESAGILYSAGAALESPLRLLDSDEWARVPIKSITSALPGSLYNDGAYPLANLYLFPVPSIGLQIALYTWRALGGFGSTAENVTFPPGYADAIRYNLACRLAPEWGRPIRPDVLELAQRSLASIKRLNRPMPTLDCDPAILRRGSGGAGSGAFLFGGASGVTNQTLLFNTFSVTDGQTVINTPLWSNALVFRNGLLQTPGSDYNAVDTSQRAYTFIVPFEAIDNVTVAHN